MARAYSGGAMIFVALSLSACTRVTETSAVKPDVPKVEPELPPRALTPPQKPAAVDDVKKLVHGNTAFALDLYAGLKDEKQLFVSPYSISTALAMLYAAARGTTADEIAKVCHFPAPPQELPDVYATLIWNQLGERKSPYQTYQKKDGKTIPIRAGYVWHDANALWGRRGGSFHAAYLDLLKNKFAAELRQADFGDRTADDEITRWVARQTQNKIADLQIKTTKDMRLVLVNAVYFKADWSAPFRPKATHDEDFHLNDKERVKTPMMHGEQMHYRYFDHAKFEMLELPYKGDASMLVLLPKKIGVAELDPVLTADNLTEWLAKLHDQAAIVTLPKFELRQDFELVKTLTALGIKQAFAPSADFSGMLPPGEFFVGDAIHATYVKLDEQGTEAAAATILKDKAPAEVKDRNVPIDFRVNRPFVFIIRDNLTGSILFLGRVTDPRDLANKGKTK